MAIPSGSYTVGGGASGELPAFCLDSSRPAPSGEMSNLLGSGAQSTRVTRLSDDVTVSLAEALAEGWLTLNGTSSATGIAVIAQGSGRYRIDIGSSFAVSEDLGEPLGDIESTLSWLDTQDTSKFESAGPVWQYRETAAISELGGYKKYSYLFRGPVELLELQHRVHEAGPSTIALTHSRTDSDAYDRVAVTSDFDIRVFSGPNADRDLFHDLNAKSGLTNVWLVNEHKFEQAQIEPFQRHVQEGMQFEENRFMESTWGSQEMAQAEDNWQAYRVKLSNAQRHAAEIGLALSAGQYGQTMTFSALPLAGSGGGGIINRNGIIESFEDNEPPSSAGSDGGDGIPPVIKASIEASVGSQRIGRVPQGSHIWTTISRSLTAAAELATGVSAKVDASFKVAFGTLISAVEQDQSRQEIVESVQSSLELNKEAYEAYPTLGEIEIQLWFDSGEELKMRVAIIETAVGIRFAALND